MDLSTEAQAILSTPFPAKVALIQAASEQVKAEVAIVCGQRLNAKFPEKKAVTNAMTANILEGKKIKIPLYVRSARYILTLHIRILYLQIEQWILKLWLAIINPRSDC
jgi:hypothetical protein